MILLKIPALLIMKCFFDYIIYEKSPKKCRELEDIVKTLKTCLGSDEFSHGRGVRPLRASGTRFVTHKVAALNRVLERFDACVNHLCSQPKILV